MISIINGDANAHFYRELIAQQVSPKDVPVMALSVGERELQDIGGSGLTGQLAAWNYFKSVKSEENDAFIKMWADFTEQRDTTTNDPMEATFSGGCTELVFKDW